MFFFLGKSFKTLSSVVCGLILLAMTRCQASSVAVSVAIAMMLQKKERHFNKTGGYNVQAIIQDSYDIAVKFIETEDQVGI